MIKIRKFYGSLNEISLEQEDGNALGYSDGDE